MTAARPLGEQLQLLAAQTALFEMGASSKEAMFIMLREDEVLLDIQRAPDPKIWALLALDQYRSVQFAEPRST
jgi:hypothetical protein